MQSLIATARNISHSIHDNELYSTIEAVLTVSDKQFQFVGASLVNAEFTKSIRFEMSPDDARRLSEKLLKWADDADSQHARLELLQEIKSDPASRETA